MHYRGNVTDLAAGQPEFTKAKRPVRVAAVGALAERNYFEVDGAAAAFLCFLDFLAFFGALVVLPDAAGASADIGAAVFGISAAIAPAARPRVIKAEAINIPDLFIVSPARGFTSGGKNTLDPDH